MIANPASNPLNEASMSTVAEQLHAARIMDELENRGIVGSSKGAEPRDILIDLDGGGADGAGQGAV
jgi:DNA segregation ATPase FtsK/SpoIIIE-like protein